jgi:membrane protease YdiL (CAAX protease family)
MDEPSDPVSPIPSLMPRPRENSFNSLLAKALFGPNGLRALWRLLVFVAILCGLFSVGVLILRRMASGRAPRSGLSPGALTAGEASVFGAFLVASWIMSIIEGRKVADYGLPWRRAFGGKFWIGAAIGFASITALLVAMRVIGVVHFGAIGLHGSEVWKYAFLWAFALLFVALFEEFAFRGYALFTLTTGIGFWPAAIVSSLLFGYVHHNNSGENWLGAFSAGLVGMLFCLLLRRTGDLWMPIGFHTAWDWGETYFYGTPDSGQLTPGHLFNANFSGPEWLTGGTVGPEASWLCLLLLALLWCIFAARLREAKYPDPAAIPGPRRALDLPQARARTEGQLYE